VGSLDTELRTDLFIFRPLPVLLVQNLLPLGVTDHKYLNIYSKQNGMN
jgi:hypothetical protein